MSPPALATSVHQEKLQHERQKQRWEEMDWFDVVAAESAAEVSHCLHQMTLGSLLHRTLVDKMGKKWGEAHSAVGKEVYMYK